MYFQVNVAFYGVVYMCTSVFFNGTYYGHKKGMKKKLLYVVQHLSEFSNGEDEDPLLSRSSDYYEP